MKRFSMRVAFALFVGLALTVAGTTMGFLGLGAGVMGAAYGAACVSVLFGFIDKMDTLKIFGLEAKLRRTILEADETLERLKGILRPLSEMVFTLAARAGRWDSSIPRIDQLRVISEFRRQLVETGMPEAEVDALAKEWVALTARDLLAPLLEQMSNLVQVKRQAITEQQRNFQKPIPAGDPKWLALHESAQAHAAVAGDVYKLPADPTAVRRFIETCQLFTQDERVQLLEGSKDRLAELEHFLAHKRFLNAERWLAEDPLSRPPNA